MEDNVTWGGMIEGANTVQGHKRLGQSQPASVQMDIDNSELGNVPLPQIPGGKGSTRGK